MEGMTPRVGNRIHRLPRRAGADVFRTVASGSSADHNLRIMSCRNLLVWLSLSLVFAVGETVGAESREADRSAAGTAPVLGTPRTDENSRIAHEELLTKAKSGRIDLYFEGDSITRRWGCSDAAYRGLLESWKTNFHGWNAGDFGWGGDRVENVLWRLQNGELDGVNPKAVVLMAGTNNLREERDRKADSEAAQVEEVVSGLRAVLVVIHAKAPAAKVVLMGITPRKDRSGAPAYVATIRKINQRLAELADGKGVRFIDLSDRLGDADGKPLDGMTVDGLHLSAKGYQIWADALKPVLTEILGPRAETDLAPPPTGDPSARRR
jgi:lysophospholipase L1-like esterase